MLRATKKTPVLAIRKPSHEPLPARPAMTAMLMAGVSVGAMLATDWPMQSTSPSALRRSCGRSLSTVMASAGSKELPAFGRHRRKARRVGNVARASRRRDPCCAGSAALQSRSWDEAKRRKSGSGEPRSQQENIPPGAAGWAMWRERPAGDPCCAGSAALQSRSWDEANRRKSGSGEPRSQQENIPPGAAGWAMWRERPAVAIRAALGARLSRAAHGTRQTEERAALESRAPSGRTSLLAKTGTGICY